MIKKPIYFLTLFCFIFSACVSVQREYLPVKEFQVHTDAPRFPEEPDPGITLKVEKLKTSSRYEDRMFIYRISDSEYQRDFYNQMALYPADLLTEQLRSWVIHASGVRYLVNDTSSVVSDYILIGRLVDMYGDYRDELSPKAYLHLEFSLIDGRNRSVKWQKHYEKESLLESTGPRVLIKGWDDLLTETFQSLNKDIGNYLSKKE